MKKGKIKSLYGFLAVFGSNILSLLISVLITLLFPKVLSEIDYSYFQLYIFYSSFVVFGHLGIVDGIYLRYGGIFYHELNFTLLNAQFKVLIFIECLIAIFLLLIGLHEPVYEKSIVFIICSIALLLSNARIFYSQLLLTTARMNEYARVMLLERIVFISLSLLYFTISEQNTFEVVCLLDLIARACSYVYVRKIMPEIQLFGKFDLRKGSSEVVINWLSGINLYFSNMVSMLSVGIFRFLIEKKWDIIVFGKVSLAISAVGSFVILSNAASLALFPAMRRIEETYMKEGFIIANDILCWFGLLLQWFYFPLCGVLKIWLPNYADSFFYMGLLFPMCVYDIKWTSLESTILKVKRKEKYILYINGLSILLSSIFGVFIWLNLCTLTSAMIGIVIVFLCKHIMGLIIVRRQLSIDKYSPHTECITFIIVTLYYMIVVNADTLNGGLMYGALMILLGIGGIRPIRKKMEQFNALFKKA